MTIEIDSVIAQMLREYAERYETEDFIVGDPSWWMHQVSGVDNQEVVAFVASVLSYGSRQQFMPKIQTLLEWCGGEMDQWLRDGDFRKRFSSDDKRCFYRLYNYGCMYRFLEVYSRMLNQYGSMGEYLRSRVGGGFDAVEAICRYFSENGVSVVVPKDTTSACKRVCMFLRWMVRDSSPVDLGLWADFIDRRTLIMPLDTHVVSQSVRLGLLRSTSASMSAARRLTEAMSSVFPDDPLRGDFALFGYGVNNK